MNREWIAKRTLKRELTDRDIHGLFKLLEDTNLDVSLLLMPQASNPPTYWNRGRWTETD